MGSCARTLGLLYVAGAGTALVWVALPHTPSRGDGVVVLMAALAMVLGGLLVAVAERVPVALLHVTLAAIQVVIAVAYLAGADSTGDLRLFFLWATPYAALYWGVRAAAAHLAWTGAVVITCLLIISDTVHRNGPSIAVMLLATLGATGVLAMTAAAALRTAETTQRHDATHDLLTGLGNRRRLLEVLEGALTSCSAPDEQASALVLLDLTGFKAINDQYGHAAGDELLRDVGRCLSQAVRLQDVACRLGGDEFALVVHGVGGAEQARAVAVRAVAAARAARVRSAPGLMVGAGAGVRLLDDPHLTASGVLRDADAALYAAKRAQRNSACLWTRALQRDDDDQVTMAADLRADLMNDHDHDHDHERSGRLRLVYQPVVDITTLRVAGLEALIRWRHPVRGDVPPDQFVPCAERAGLIGELTRWVLHRALSDARSWPVNLQEADLNLALNISALQLTDLQIVADVHEALSRSPVPPGSIVLEVTETAAVDDLSSARRTLTALADLGVALALDDFGTGYSSLSYVHALPFHILKVDRSFVAAAAAGDRKATATIAAVGALAAQLHVDVVAEGVEDPTELSALHALGCRYAQGFGLSRPLETAAITTALTLRGADHWALEPSTTAHPPLSAAPSQRQAPRESVAQPD